MRAALAAIAFSFVSYLALAEGGPDSVRLCDKTSCRYVDQRAQEPAPPAQRSRSSRGTPRAIAQKAKPAPARSAGVATIRSKAGRTASVSSRYASRFQCLVDGLEAGGYRIDFMGGIRAGSCSLPHNTANLHPCGYALDVNQTARDRVTRAFPRNVNEIANRCGLLHGDRVAWSRSPDQGHFQVRLDVADEKVKPSWPRTLEQAERKEERLYTDRGALVESVRELAGYSLARIARPVRSHAEKVVAAAELHRVDPRYQLAMVYMESSFDPSDRARTSSAYGLCQLLRADRKRFGLGDRPSVEAQAEACAIKSGKNINDFRSIFSRDPTPQEAYLVHWQGMAGATLLLMANKDEQVRSVLNRIVDEKNWGDVVVRANPVLRGMTVEAYLRHIDKRMRYALELVGGA